MTRRRGNNAFQKNIRDYIVPIIWGILVLFLIFSIFSWGDDTTTNIENKSWISISLDSETSQATIIYPWDYKKDIEWETSLYKWEKILVKQWSISMSFDNMINFRINRLWELKYLENGNFAVSSWEVWIDASKPLNLDLNFAKLKIDENSHLSISQNEMWSTIYLVSWFVEVENLVWKNTVLAPWEKITISRSDASKDSLDLTLIKESLDQFFLKSDWYILNKWSSYLDIVDENKLDDKLETQTWSTLTSSNTGEILNFNNLIDNSNVSSPLINISWSYSDVEVSSILVNNKKATLNKDSKTFKFENIDVSSKENDLVFKIYDDSNELISRFVYTVYYSLWSDSTDNLSTNNQIKPTSSPKVNNFDVDGSKFTFTSPTTEDTYTTTDTFVTIRWNVKLDWIDSVTVNEFKLNSFNWSTWRYHADVSYNNLDEWTNVYEVKYYSWEKLIYINYFTIIKKSTDSKKSDETTDVSNN